MNYPYDGDTMLIIDIQAANQLEILTCVRETFSFMPGWVFNSSAKSSPKDARFYIFNLSCHTFSWWRTNESLSDTMDADEVVIKDLADISHLLEFIYENTEALREKDEFVSAFGSLYGKIDISQIAKTMLDASDHIEKNTYSEFEPMGFIKIKPMAHLPSGKVFYKDLSKFAAEVCPPKNTMHADGFDAEMDALMTAKMEAYFTYSEQKQMTKAYSAYEAQWYGHKYNKYEGVMVKPHASCAMAADSHHYYPMDY